MTILELDDRRRASLGKVGRKEHTRYIVTEEDDGTLILTPAIVVSSKIGKQLRDGVEAAQRGDVVPLDKVLRDAGLED